MLSSWSRILEHPEWASSVVLTVLAVAAGIAGARFIARRRRNRLGASIRPGISLTRDLALLMALACIGLALLGPRIGTRTVQITGSGVDIVLLFDLSRSMDASDVPPSRLDRARRAALGLMARLGAGDRIALAAFGDRGVLLTPLTPDRDALVELIGALDTSLIQPAGSNLAAGVQAAVEAFEPGSERPRVVVILSDGESPRTPGRLGSDAALAMDVRVVSVAYGTDTGGRIPDHGLSLRNEAGSVIVTRRNTERLERIAALTGGRSFACDRWGEIDEVEFAATVRRDTGNLTGAPVERQVQAVRVLPLAALAFILLGFESLEPRRTRARTGQASFGIRRRQTLAAITVAAFSFGASPAPDDAGSSDAPESHSTQSLEAALRLEPGDPRLLIELGLARLARGRHEAAQRALLAAALGTSDHRLAVLAYYNLGVAALEGGDYAAARDAFFDVLALSPDHAHARFNLEWSLAALATRPPDGEAPPPKGPATVKLQPAAPPDSPPTPTSAEPQAPPEARPPQPDLDRERRKRWLSRINDDPTTALRSARTAAEREPRRRRIAW